MKGIGALRRDYHCEYEWHSEQRPERHQASHAQVVVLPELTLTSKCPSGQIRPPYCQSLRFNELHIMYRFEASSWTPWRRTIKRPSWGFLWCPCVKLPDPVNKSVLSALSRNSTGRVMSDFWPPKRRAVGNGTYVFGQVCL